MFCILWTNFTLIRYILLIEKFVNKNIFAFQLVLISISTQGLLVYHVLFLSKKRDIVLKPIWLITAVTKTTFLKLQDYAALTGILRGNAAFVCLYHADRTFCTVFDIKLWLNEMDFAISDQLKWQITFCKVRNSKFLMK